MVATIAAVGTTAGAAGAGVAFWLEGAGGGVTVVELMKRAPGRNAIRCSKSFFCKELFALPGSYLPFWRRPSGENAQLFFDRLGGLDPNFHELDPDPYTREAIADFATSLNFHVRPRQAKSQVDDGSLVEMCRSIHEHPVQAEVGRANLDFRVISLVAQMELREVLNSAFSTARRGYGSRGGRFFQESTPSLRWDATPTLEPGSLSARRTPQCGQNR